MEKELIIYSEKNNRTRYLFETIIPDIFNITCTLIDDADAYNGAKGIKVNYSKNKEIEGVYFLPSGLLSETNIESNYPQVVWHENLPHIYINETKFGYDPFSAAFFMLSRYEEYIHPNRDHHGRFEAKNSIAFNHGFLKMPVVELWLKSSLEHVQKARPEFNFAYRHSFKITPTFDLDNAYAYRGKGFVRNIGGLLRDGLTLKLKLVARRVVVLLGKRNDPYDTYAKILLACNKHETIFFIPVGNRSEYDKNLPATNENFKQLIEQLKLAGVGIGIHPSYASNKDVKLLTKEVKCLQNVLNQQVEHSRQHYLKLRLPQTYRELKKLGIHHDYTMGYADQVGFRAGIARPFKFFDLDQNEEIEFTVHPFAYMDGTFHDYLKYSIEEAVDEIKKLKAAVKSCEGDFTFIWHNDSVRDADDWKGWQHVFEMSLIDD